MLAITAIRNRCMRSLLGLHGLDVDRLLLAVRAVGARLDTAIAEIAPLAPREASSPYEELEGLEVPGAAMSVEIKDLLRGEQVRRPSRSVLVDQTVTSARVGEEVPARVRNGDPHDTAGAQHPMGLLDQLSGGFEGQVLEKVLMEDRLGGVVREGQPVG